jgi:hypothetical protein
VAISVQGRTWRHDPASGRTPELMSCPGSLKPVTAPAGALLLFVSPDDAAASDPDGSVAPEPVALF